MSKWLRGTLVAVVVIALVLIGAFRDFLFVNINFQLHYMWANLTTNKTHSFFSFLNDYTYWEIYYAKFALTGIFALIYLALTLLLLKLIFNQRRYAKITIILFAVMIGISLIFFGGGYLFGDPHTGYDLARHFMGIVQSPMPAMVLIPFFLLWKQLQPATAKNLPD